MNEATGAGAWRSTDQYDELYREGGFGYESQRPKWEAWVGRNYVAEFGLHPGESLLDAGCGDGFWASIFKRMGFRVAGFDISPGGIEVAQSRYRGIDFRVADVERPLPFPEASFDIVFCRSIGHLNRHDLFPEDSFAMAANLMRAVKPGGLLLVSHYTKRDGGGTPEHAYHRVSGLVRLFESAGDVFKVDLVNNYVQIGVQHWDAPRQRPLASAPNKSVGIRRVKRAISRVLGR